MSMKITTKGDWKKTFDFLHKAEKLSDRSKKVINAIGERGVQALAENTPIRTGRLASSWGYKIEEKPGKTIIIWTNNDIENGENIALLVQHGHATKGGHYVSGTDMITPALEPIFNSFLETIWKEVIGE